MSAVPFWKTKTLKQMTPSEWESLCDGCAKCCLVKLEDETTNDLYFTGLHCKLLDGNSCQCTNYPDRKKYVPVCVKLTPEIVATVDWLPQSCAYRLVHEGKDLHSWHHLISGDREAVHDAGFSCRGKTRTEEGIDDEDAFDYVIDWFHGPPKPRRLRKKKEVITGAYCFPRQDTVIYGRPAHEAVIDLAKRYNAQRLFILTTRSLASTAAAKLAADLGSLCAGTFSAISSHSPRSDVIAGAFAAREAKADLLIALGGGSVIDATKLIQLCLWADLFKTDQLSPYRMGRGDDRKDASQIPTGIRTIAIPTTLSAAEFTPFAGITDGENNVKESYTHPDFAPRAVILDPALSLSTPLRLWSSTGMKAVDHAVEQLCNLERSPMGDAVAAEGLRLLTKGLRASHDNPNDLEARSQCQHGMWLSISGAATGRGMGASHAIGHTLGGSYGVPHGITSCITLHATLTWNRDYSIDRQTLVSRLMGKRALPAADVVRDLVKALGLPWRLSELLIGASQHRAIADHTMHDRSIRTNPRPIRRAEDIVEILELCA